MNLGVAAALGVCVLAALLVSEPVRQLSLFAALSLAPGFALLRMLGVQDRATVVALVVPTSLAVDLLVASLWTYAGAWSPPLMLASVGLIVAALAISHRSDRIATGVLIAIGMLPMAVMLVGGT